MAQFQVQPANSDIASITEAESSAKSATAVKSAYPPVAPVPTQEAPHGLRFDFNLGCRVLVPPGKWHVPLLDLDTGNTLYETTTGSSTINRSKRYFIRFGFEVWDGDKSVSAHDYDATAHEVLIQFPVGTLGDLVGWFPNAVKFQERHGCRSGSMPHTASDCSSTTPTAVRS